MKRSAAGVIPLVLCCLMSPILRLIPQTSIWSPRIWEIGEMFGLGNMTAMVLTIGLAIWAGHYGTETVKRAGAVALPFVVAILVSTMILGFSTGLSGRFLPLAGTNVISADFLLISWVSAWFFDNSKKVEKN